MKKTECRISLNFYNCFLLFPSCHTYYDTSSFSDCKALNFYGHNFLYSHFIGLGYILLHNYNNNCNLLKLGLG